VTCGPLEGKSLCLCKALTCGSLFMKAQVHLDVHLGHEAHTLDDAPHLLGHIGEGTYPLEALRDHEEITLQPLTPKRWPLEA
jgi:hypothetical protein